MSLNESIVEDAALAWFRELGYAVGHGPQFALGEPLPERDSFGEMVLVGGLREAIRRLNLAIPKAAPATIRHYRIVRIPTAEGELQADSVVKEFLTTAADGGGSHRGPRGTINEHLGNIFDEGELNREATIRKFRMVRQEGGRQVARDVEHYNLDAILAVGFRVRSHRGEYLMKDEVLVRGIAVQRLAWCG